MWTFFSGGLCTQCTQGHVHNNTLQTSTYIQVDSNTIDDNVEFVNTIGTAVFLRDKGQLSFCVWPIVLENLY